MYLLPQLSRPAPFTPSCYRSDLPDQVFMLAGVTTPSASPKDGSSLAQLVSCFVAFDVFVPLTQTQYVSWSPSLSGVLS